MEIAQRVWRDHQEALARLRPHTTALATVKRFFSDEAREAYRMARDRVEYTRNTADHWGLKTEADLTQRADRWEQRKAQLPGLETQAGGLQSLLGVLSKALDGYGRAAEQRRKAIERERDAWDRMQEEIERRRQRGMDRGR